MGSAATFEAARNDFGRAWELYRKKRTPDDFYAWRHHHAWTEAKYRAWNTGMPCHCGRCRGSINWTSSVTSDNWDAEFDDPILLPDGGLLITLRDAGNYIRTLPKSLHDSERWQLAIKELLRAATEQAEWKVFARIAITKALYGRPPPIGVERRVKKRDQWRKRRRQRQ